MSDSIESQGKTVEEAVSEALLQLGARRDEVEVKVLEEGKSGFLGILGQKPARVSVRRKQRGGGRRQGTGRGRSRGRQPKGKERQAKREAAPRTERRAPAPAESAEQQGPSVKARERVEPLARVSVDKAPSQLESVATELLQRSGFPCRCEVQPGEYHLVKIVTDDSSAGILIGRHGSTVDAVEHLVERMASQAAGERINMNLDINNYRRRREQSLVERTQGLMAKVRETGREIHVEPLCARERRIIHLEVAKDDDLRTYTLAGGGGKHVVIAKAEAGQPEGAEAIQANSPAEEEPPTEGIRDI
jgi:spoIIIJ-associated protein